MPAKILVGADIVPTESNKEYFICGNMEDIVDEKIYCLLRDADFRIFNLEVPLANNAEPIAKRGPNLIAPVNSINGYKELGVDFFTLANNHIMDQGEQGLWSTIDALDSAGIAYAGVGENLKDACVPYIFECAGMNIGVYCCAEHEFSIAEENRPGANPFDPLNSLDDISKLKERCDFLICLYHGGKEHYRYPSPNLQKTCRKIAEKGADLIVCQHSHCIGCEEKWHESTIVYGQGNFLFDHSNSEFWQTSLLISIEIDECVQIQYIPIIKNGKGIKFPTQSEKVRILKEFFNRSKEIQDRSFVDEEYSKFSSKMIESYILSNDIIGNSVFMRIIYKISGKRLRKLVAKWKIHKYRLKLINQYECEAHRELILKGLKTYE